MQSGPARGPTRGPTVPITPTAASPGVHTQRVETGRTIHPGRAEPRESASLSVRSSPPEKKNSATEGPAKRDAAADAS